jgi:hypothetical protein
MGELKIDYKSKYESKKLEILFTLGKIELVVETPKELNEIHTFLKEWGNGVCREDSLDNYIKGLIEILPIVITTDIATSSRVSNNFQLFYWNKVNLNKLSGESQRIKYKEGVFKEYSNYKI